MSFLAPYMLWGALAAGIKPLAPGLRVCAPAMTAYTAPGNNLPIHQALALTPEGWVLAVATDGDATFGYWGELMNVAAMARRAAGRKHP